MTAPESASCIAVRVLVVDRVALLRRGAVDVLRSEGLDVVADTGDPDAALRLVAAARPAVVVFDAGLDDAVEGGWCAFVRREWPEVRVLVLAPAGHPTDLSGVVRAGAAGYLDRSASVEEFVDAVRGVAAGRSQLSPTVAAQILDQFATLARRSDMSDDTRLTRRELDVLRLVASGLGNRAIAERLFISENTVKNHVRNIHEKLQVHSRLEAVLRATRDGLLDVH